MPRPIAASVVPTDSAGGDDGRAGRSRARRIVAALAVTQAVGYGALPRAAWRTGCCMLRDRCPRM
jgi:hypothetical protein